MKEKHLAKETGKEEMFQCRTLLNFSLKRPNKFLKTKNALMD